MQAFVPNLGERQRRHRLIFGALGLVAAVATAAVLAAVDASVAARVIVAVPLYMAALGFLQYRKKT